MQRRRTDAAAGRRGTVWESVTPLAAGAAWLAMLAGAAVWAPVARVAGPLEPVGEAVVMTLLLHAIHEGGHVLAGLAVGLPLQSVTLGLLTVRRERRGGDGRFFVQANRSWRRFAGCVEREVSPAPGVREALTVTALGGPVASLVGGAVLVGAPDPWGYLGAVSLFVGVLNALPVTVLGQASDGMIVRRLWSRRAEHAAWRAELCGADGGPVGAAVPAP